MLMCALGFQLKQRFRTDSRFHDRNLKTPGFVPGVFYIRITSGVTKRLQDQLYYKSIFRCF